jgi:hypothetical protein
MKRSAIGESVRIVVLTVVALLGGCSKEKDHSLPSSQPSAVAVNAPRVFRPHAKPVPEHGTRDVTVQTGPEKFAVSMATPELSGLVNPEEIVLAKTTALIVVDYPIRRPYEFPISAPSARGFTRASVVRAVADVYAFIYAEELRTSKVAVTPMDARTLQNRNETNGTFGIWGHDLDDLVLHTLRIREEAAGETYVYLGIDS